MWHAYVGRERGRALWSLCRRSFRGGLSRGGRFWRCYGALRCIRLFGNDFIRGIMRRDCHDKARFARCALCFLYLFSYVYIEMYPSHQARYLFTLPVLPTWSHFVFALVNASPLGGSTSRGAHVTNDWPPSLHSTPSQLHPPVRSPHRPLTTFPRTCPRRPDMRCTPSKSVSPLRHHAGGSTLELTTVPPVPLSAKMRSTLCLFCS